MTTLITSFEGPAAIVRMSGGENRIGTSEISAWNDTLDEVLANTAVSALVVTGHDRFWSNGLDLDEYATMNDAKQRGFMRSVDLLLGRILTFPLVTVAALNGHTYAAGALLALAHDYRVMRSDRGYFCLPSVDIGIAFSPGMSALITAKLPQPIAHDLVVSCRRIGGSEAAEAGVVTDAVAKGDVMSVAQDIASTYAGKDRATLHAVKRRMYPEASSMLTTE